MTTQRNDLEFYYFRVTDVWKRLCEEHNTLLDQTCEEYSLLLGSELDNLESKIEEKKETIKRINSLESHRSEIINELNQEHGQDSPIESINDLISLMKPYEERDNEKHLYRFNALLIDIIEKIQEQNKKNQMLVNRTLSDLKNIREDAMGVKTYSTYDKRGGTKNMTAYNQR